MMVHFLAVGLVFFWPIMGVDPGPHRPGYVMRMLELFAGMPFHAFFGIALMMASEPMVGTYEHPPASLGIDALSDQNAAGGIAWAFSEIPSVIVLVALVFQWYRSEQRQARRNDRAADRDGDQELAAYNAYLASLQARGQLTPVAEPLRRGDDGPSARAGAGPGCRDRREEVGDARIREGDEVCSRWAAWSLVTAYTVALGSNGWLWFGWVVLGLLTVGVVVAR